MGNEAKDARTGSGSTVLGWRLQIAIVAVVTLTVWITHSGLSERYTRLARDQAELRLELYAGNLGAELQQSAALVPLLARDPAIAGALSTGDYAQSDMRLADLVEASAIAAVTLIDRSGRVVAATQGDRLSADVSQTEFFASALAGGDAPFNVTRGDGGTIGFVKARAVESGGEIVGVIAVDVDLAKFESIWAGVTEALIVQDPAGVIILSTELGWRGLNEAGAIASAGPQPRYGIGYRSATNWVNKSADMFVGARPVLRLQTAVPFQDWNMVSYVSYAPIRERVFTVIFAELLIFFIALTCLLYYFNKKSRSRATFFQRESDKLRELNERLQNEIAERIRVQEDLAVAEQTLEQSSKLAALGEMSAAVSHELNQPLAAMKTYLAGARLLLSRNRPDEALASFGRIDDLIERMGAITKQLKSYARKGQQALSPVDMADAIGSCLSMMEPQLRERYILINPILPSGRVRVLGDRMRIEQVLVNLLRNAIDATKSEPAPQIDIILSAGETATVTVRDNGPGIDDLDSLFEPFYTTKQPGDGVGLGLAISSGIVAELGGRLTARNGGDGGAVFEMQLPILEAGAKVQAAE